MILPVHRSCLSLVRRAGANVMLLSERFGYGGI